MTTALASPSPPGTPMSREARSRRYFNAAYKAFGEGHLHRARELYSKAADVGSRAALHNLGVMYLHGQGVAQDYDQARSLFIRSAFDGVHESMAQLGAMYLYGKGVHADFQKARIWFLRAAEMGQNAFAQYHLGCLYALGKGVERDPQIAAEWLGDAAAQGYAPAQYNLATLYFHGLGVVQNDRRAAELYKEAAAQGHERAQNNLAALYLAGRGVRRSTSKAAALVRRAAHDDASEAGHEHMSASRPVPVPEAALNLSDAYFSGVGVRRDTARGWQWLRRAAHAHSPDAEFALGCAYLTADDGSGAGADVALRLFRRASRSGHAPAQHNLRVLREYRAGRIPGTEQPLLSVTFQDAPRVYA